MSIPVESRPLNADEKRVLDRLLTVDFPGAPELRAQVRHSTVVGRCECGCATVDLAVDRVAAPPALDCPGSPILAEATVLGDDGQPVGGVIAFLDGGYLSMLEIYSHDAPIREWPSQERLVVDRRDA